MNPSVSIESGVVEGVRVGDVLHYRGIPYAVASRFADPSPVPRWEGIRDGSRHGPMCPQPPSRLDPVMGIRPVEPEDEACLTLSVATPVVDSERLRPVMVWVHGGAYVIGSGTSAWYRQDRLVAEGDVIVVCVNYRLGAFGNLRADGVSSGNLGLRDQIAALRWVSRNIAAFGGDPSLVTIFGESAGGHSVTALMSIRETKGLFRRAIVQSGHLGLGFTTSRAAERAGRAVLAALGKSEPRTASVNELLAAQDAAAVKLAGPAGLNSAPMFGPIAGVPPLPRQPDIVKAIVHRDVDLLIGTVRDEMRAFFDTDRLLFRARSLPVLGRHFADALVLLVTRQVFTEPARKLADAHARDGAAVYRYLFEWEPPREAFGICHTIELPFVFGDREAWSEAPMLGGASWDEVDRVGRQMRRAWTRFAHSGDPNTPEDPRWPRHLPGAAVGRRFQ